MSDEGRLVAGRYRLDRRIGAGAMGVVWQAKDERLQRVVAVKQLLLQPGLARAEAEEAKQRAMREGRIAARLQHPNAIGVFDVAEDDGTPWLIMEYLPSKSLAALVSERGPLPPRETARIGAQVAWALAAAHAAGIVHRDIKPGNVLIGHDGTVKITDFGISRAVGDVTVTKTGMLAGTPAYLAPEVAKGYEPGPPSDVFSLGSTLYALVEGEPPFGLNENTLALLHAVAAGRFRSPQRAGALTPVLFHLLQTDPAERPAMRQSGEALFAIANGRPTPLSTPPGGWATVVTPTTQLPNGPSAPTQTMPPRAPLPQRAQASNPAMTRLDARPMAETSIARTAETSQSSRPAARAVSLPEEPEATERKRKTVLIAAGVAVVVALATILLINAFTKNESGASTPTTTSSQAPNLPTGSKKTSTKTSTETSSETSTTEPSDASETTDASETSTATTTPTVSAKEQVEEVHTYYGLLPKNISSAWNRLGPGMQTGGYSGYQRFWSEVKALKWTATSAGRNKVRVNLEYVKKDSDKPVAEQKTLTMITDADGNPRINAEA